MHRGSIRVLHLIFGNGKSGSSANNQAISQQRSRRGKFKIRKTLSKYWQITKPNCQVKKMKSNQFDWGGGGVVDCISGLIISWYGSSKHHSFPSCRDLLERVISVFRSSSRESF